MPKNDAQDWVVGFRDMFDGTSNNRSGTLSTGPLAGDVVNFNNQWFDTLTHAAAAFGSF